MSSAERSTPHSGSTTLDVSTLLPQGDEGGIPDHGGGSYTNDADTIVRFSKLDDSTDSGDLWYSGGFPAQIAITVQDGTKTGPVAPGASLTGNGIAIYQYDY